MSGFAKGFNQSVQDAKDKRFQERRDQKQQDADMAKLAEQYRLQFKNNSELAQQEFKRTTGLEVSKIHNYLTAQGVSEDSPEYNSKFNSIYATGLDKYMDHENKMKLERFKIENREPDILTYGPIKVKRTAQGLQNVATGQIETQETLNKAYENEKFMEYSLKKQGDDSEAIRKEFREKYDANQSVINGYGTLVAQLTNAETGPGTSIKFTAQKLADFVGLPTDKLSFDARGQIEVASMQQLVNAIADYKGAMSNHEMDKFLKSVVGLDQTEGTNLFIANVTYAMAQRQEFIRKGIQELVATGKEEYRFESKARDEIVRQMDAREGKYYRPFISEKKLDSRTGTPMLYSVFEYQLRNHPDPAVRAKASTDEGVRELWNQWENE